MKKIVKSRDKATLTIVAIIVLLAVVISIIVLSFSSLSLNKNFDSRTYNQLENIARLKSLTVKNFISSNFRVIEGVAKYIGENGKEEFDNVAELIFEMQDYVVLGISDAQGNAHCTTCDENEDFYEVFPNADKVLKDGQRIINIVSECGDIPFFGFAVPIYKDGNVVGSVYAGIGRESFEELLYTVGLDYQEVVFIADENGRIFAGDKKFNEYLKVDSIDDYYNGDSAVDGILSNLKAEKSGRFKTVHDESDFGVYIPVGVEKFSIFATAGRTVAVDNVKENQSLYQKITISLIITILVLTVITVVVLVANAKRLIDASRKAIDQEQYKERVYRNAILSNCLGYFEVNLSDGTVTEMSKIKFMDDSLPDELRVGNGRNVSFGSLMNWIAESMKIEDKEEFVMLNSSEYLLSCFENNELMVESFCRPYVRGTIICRNVYYMYKNKFDGKIYAFCTIHDITEKYNSEQEIKKLVGEVRDAALRTSASQMQPHFLYNALASIREIILEDPQYASDLVYDFTTYLRACVRSMSNENVIPFSQELENIRAYVNIEKMRFGDRLKIKTEIEEYDFGIVPLSIQPLVENAIRHGIYQKGSAGGTVTVKTFKENEKIIIQVIDDGVGFDYEKITQEIREGKRDSSGLENIKFRLNKLMNADVKIESKPGSGTTVTIRTNVLGGGADLCVRLLLMMNP